MYSDYKIVDSIDCGVMQRMVRDLMAQGWVPQGGVCAVQHAPHKVSVGQAMGLPVEDGHGCRCKGVGR